MRHKTGMCTLAIQFLTGALTGTLRAQKGQSVLDPPSPKEDMLKEG